MTPEEIKAGHTYEMDDEFSRTVVSTHGGELTYRDCYGVSECSVAYFARHAVRDITPAPESGQGEKVAQAQSQGASRGCGVAELTADDWLQIEMAAKGCVSGTSDEWPGLAAAIAKLRGKPFVRRVSSAWLEGFCVGVMSMRRTPPAADAIAKAEAGAHSHPRFRHRRTGDTYELLLIANEHAERTAQYPPTAVYRRVSDRTVWSRPVQDWGKDFEEVSGE